MREIKELLDELAANPAPPMPSSALMLAEACRAERRYRHRVVAAGGAVVTVLAIVAVIATVPLWARTGTLTEPAVRV